MCLIFTRDHSVAKAPEDGGENCSSYSQAVTKNVLVGLEREIAGASLLARVNGTSLRVIDVRVAGETNENSVVNASPNKLKGGGTANCCTNSGTIHSFWRR